MFSLYIHDCSYCLLVSSASYSFSMLVFTPLAQELWTPENKKFSGLGLAG